MLGRRDEAAIQTDAYIDALLAAHGGLAVVLPQPQLQAWPQRQLAPPLLPGSQLPPEPEALLEPDLRRAIELLERGLPRIHPSFIFEEQLSARLRRAALAQTAAEPGALGGEPLSLPFAPVALSALPAVVDRRLLLGGAIASGVSLAGAAMIAWRMRERARPRRRWLA